MKVDNQSTLRIGIDIGGTFTDFVIYYQITGEFKTLKLLSTPENPAEVVLEGIQIILDKILSQNSQISPRVSITHGSTIATNSLLERKGARTALVTTKGFKDVLQIGRQDRPELYDLEVQPRPTLIPRKLRFEVDERVDQQGKALREIDGKEIKILLDRIQSESVESIAICLLFSFQNPEHEHLIAKELRKRGYFVSVSSEILPEYREYERTSTTVINAYVTPSLDRYLSYLDTSLPLSNSYLRVMQSNGGIIGLDEARRAGVRCILSGPAGGVVGASHIARAAQVIDSPGILNLDSKENLKVITFDMGGTSTDVSLVNQHPAVTTETSIGGYPISIPVLDIHTIGAGGGSIASIDLGGALRVGPESAGAEPGPACYGISDEASVFPTVTDANVVLGRLPTEYFLGGKMRLDYDRAHQVLALLGEEVGLNGVQTARGVIDVINAHMERAIRLVSIERGFDPGEFTLISFGGAGGLHACGLAQNLGIPNVIVPPLASTLSALGMLVADVIKDYSRTIMISGEHSIEQIQRAFKPMVDQGRSEMKGEGFTPDQIRLELNLDMRYRGQSYELTISYSDNYMEEFHRQHEISYGYARRESEVEIVNVRLRAIGLVAPPPLTNQPINSVDPAQAYLRDQRTLINDDMRNVPLFDGELLIPGNELTGPAIVVRKDTTVFLPDGNNAFVDQLNNLIISIL